MSLSPLETRRALRANSTDAERRLWEFLRAKRIGVKFRRQHSFGGFIVDFYCPSARLVIELDGRQQIDPEHAKNDVRRTRVLEGLGLRVVRFTNAEVLHRTDLVLKTIVRAVGSPLPHPLPRKDSEPER